MGSAPPAKRAHTRSPWFEFCHEQQLLLPTGLDTAEKEKLLVKKWKALSKAEKANYKVGVSRAPAPASAAVALTPRIALTPSASAAPASSASTDPEQMEIGALALFDQLMEEEDTTIIPDVCEGGPSTSAQPV